MKLVDWHPEDLIEKRHDGCLDDDEAERLQKHLQGCAACRFEALVADDLDGELGEQSDEELSRLVMLAVSSGESDAKPVSRDASRGGSRVALGLVLAGALIAGSAAALRGEPAPPRQVERVIGDVSSVVVPASLRSTPESTASTAGPAPPAAEPEASSHAADTASPHPSGSPRSSASTATAASLFSEANAARRANDSQRALGLYRQLQQQFPSSPEARLSQAITGRMLLDGKDPKAALDAFDGYLKKGGRLSEEALVGRAVALHKLGDQAQERAAWQALLAQYPRSLHAGRARARLSALKNAK